MYRITSKPESENDMTVCIAARFDKGIIVVTDMTRTNAKTERTREIPVAKSFGFSKHIVALRADDMALQNELCSAAGLTLSTKYSDEIFLVTDALEAYIEAYKQAKQKRLVLNIYSDYGYNTIDEYHSDKERDPVTTQEILQRVARFKMPPIQTLIVGLDVNGEHIWYFDGEDPQNCGDDGFASIGQGINEIEYQFSKMSYGWDLSREDVVSIAYFAKARAEDFLGVKSATFVSEITVKGTAHIPEPLLMELYEIYNLLEAAIMTNETQARRMFGKISNMAANMEQEENKRGRSQGRATKKDSETEGSFFLNKIFWMA